MKLGKRHRSALTAVLALATVSSLQASTAEAVRCPFNNNGPHFYASANSGTGNLYGTGAHATTWSSWSLGGHPVSDMAFSNQAVWGIDSTNQQTALEVGFNTGYGAPNRHIQQYYLPILHSIKWRHRARLHGNLAPDEHCHLEQCDFRRHLFISIR